MGTNEKGAMSEEVRKKDNNGDVAYIRDRGTPRGRRVSVHCADNGGQASASACSSAIYTRPLKAVQLTLRLGLPRDVRGRKNSHILRPWTKRRDGPGNDLAVVELL